MADSERIVVPRRKPERPGVDALERRHDERIVDRREAARTLRQRWSDRYDQVWFRTQGAYVADCMTLSCIGARQRSQLSAAAASWPPAVRARSRTSAGPRVRPVARRDCGADGLRASVEVESFSSREARCAARPATVQRTELQIRRLRACGDLSKRLRFRKATVTKSHLGSCELRTREPGVADSRRACTMLRSSASARRPSKLVECFEQERLEFVAEAISRDDVECSIPVAPTSVVRRGTSRRCRARE